jgi:hypothetical protein
MPYTRSKAATSPTDVPPNFITVGPDARLKSGMSSTVCYVFVKLPMIEKIPPGLSHGG